MDAKEVIEQVVSMLSAYYQEPTDISEVKAELDEYDGDNKEQALINTVTSKMMVTLVSEIATFGVIPKEEIMEMFNRSR